MTLLLSTLTSAAQNKDTLYFFNKSKVVGELNKIRLGFVEFDADGIGIIKVKNNKLESIHAQSRNFRIETIEGDVLQGYLLQGELPGNVIIYSVLETLEIDIEEITSLVYFGQTWKSRLNGSIGAGYSYTKSSSIGRFNFNSTLRYNTARTETVLKGDIIWTLDSVQFTRDRENASLGFTYTLPSQWSTGGLVVYQRNLELGLEKRWQQALVLGRKLLINKNQQAVLLSGLAINQESNLEGTQRDNTEAMIQATYNLFSFSKPNITLSLIQSGYFSVTQKGRIRSDGSTTMSWELISDFNLNLEFYHNYDSQSPATGAANTDYGFVAGLNFKF